MKGASEDYLNILESIPECLIKLVRMVVSGFYTPEHRLVVELLIVKKSLKENDFTDLMKLHKRQVMKLVGDLAAGRIISSDVVEELSLATQSYSRYNRAPKKPSTWYYIDYEKMVSMVKWRLDGVGKALERMANTRRDNQGYECPTCDATYTALDAGTLIDFDNPGQLTCPVCQGEVIEVEVKADADEGAVSYFNRQMTPITDCLNECDKVVIPDKRVQIMSSRMAFNNDTSDAAAEAKRSFIEAHNKKKQSLWSGRDFLGDINAHLDIKLDPGNAMMIPTLIEDGDLAAAYITYYLMSNTLTDVKNNTRSGNAQKIIDKAPDPEMDGVDTDLNMEDVDGEDTDSFSDSSQYEDNTSDSDFAEADKSRYWMDLIYDSSHAVAVGGESIPLNSITTEHIKSMTDGEYNAFFDKVNSLRINFLNKKKANARRKLDRETRRDIKMRRQTKSAEREKKNCTLSTSSTRDMDASVDIDMDAQATLNKTTLQSQFPADSDVMMI
eukprot:CFRG6605T1